MSKRPPDKPRIRRLNGKWFVDWPSVDGEYGIGWYKLSDAFQDAAVLWASEGGNLWRVTKN